MHQKPDSRIIVLQRRRDAAPNGPSLTIVLNPHRVPEYLSHFLPSIDPVQHVPGHALSIHLSVFVTSPLRPSEDI